MCQITDKGNFQRTIFSYGKREFTINICDCSIVSTFFYYIRSNDRFSILVINCSLQLFFILLGFLYFQTRQDYVIIHKLIFQVMSG